MWGNVYATNSEGELGPVCDDSWDITDATVVCRQLGLHGQVSFTTNSAFGPVSTDTAMDYVHCLGTEAYLQVDMTWLIT